VAWYFGKSDPGEAPFPILVGRMNRLLNLHDFRRSLIDGGELLTVVLHENAVSDVLPRFGNERCMNTPAGRWLNFAGRACEVPYCTGEIEEVLGRDWVSVTVLVSPHRSLGVCLRDVNCFDIA
jgi:hypothetical protein